MAIKSEICWNRKDDEGEKLEVYARRFGGEWQFHSRRRRNEIWQPIPKPSLEDWLELADAIRRRIPRRLYPPIELDRVVQEIRQRFPDFRGLED